MNKLNKLFTLINHFNRYAKTELISENENYYFYKINNGYAAEILKDSLSKMSIDELAAESRYILKTY